MGRVMKADTVLACVAAMAIVLVAVIAALLAAH